MKNPRLSIVLCPGAPSCLTLPKLRYFYAYCWVGMAERKLCACALQQLELPGPGGWVCESRPRHRHQFLLAVGLGPLPSLFSPGPGQKRTRDTPVKRIQWCSSPSAFCLTPRTKHDFVSCLKEKPGHVRLLLMIATLNEQDFCLARGVSSALKAVNRFSPASSVLEVPS